MSGSSIALVIDSCTDVPLEEIERFGMYVVPMQVNYENESYLDKVTITSAQVCERLGEEIPKTSTPTLAVVSEVLDRVVRDGFTQAVAVTISSGLSSTHDLVRSVAAGVPNLKTLVVDTKNIGLGAGLVVMAVAELIEQGASLEEIERAVPGIVADTRVYFCVDTLDYLLRGGRIGKVTHVIGSVLDMRPVISCNEDGVYYTVSKAKGRRKSLKSAAACALRDAARFDTCVMAVAHAGAEAEMEQMRAGLQDEIPHARAWYAGEVSPALLVHTGPGLVGVAVQGDSWRGAGEHASAEGVADGASGARADAADDATGAVDAAGAAEAAAADGAAAGTAEAPASPANAGDKLGSLAGKAGQAGQALAERARKIVRERTQR